MKNNILVFIFLICSSLLSAQEKFVLKDPDTLRLKKEHENSNYGINTVLTHLERNYKSISGKLDIKLDPEFNNQECGFTKKFESGITYTLYNCGEAMPYKEYLTFPKVASKTLKKWIELMYASWGQDIKNKWYKGKNEYGPEDEEAGCYYKLKQTKTQSKVDIWCGS